MNKSIELVSRTGEIRLLEELDDTTLKIKGTANITRQLFNKGERDVFMISFKGGPILEVGQNIDGFIIESIEYVTAEENFFIIKGKKV